jgi:hypothetical protein
MIGQSEGEDIAGRAAVEALRHGIYPDFASDLSSLR